ncbi:MAG: GHMP kinase [Anaerolineae bacterium]|nr:GHMP kinase [Anaerolineae bacterium]
MPNSNTTWRHNVTIIRSRAPLRISFAGGGTDVEPYLSEQGGAVLSTTIDRYAYASLRLREDRQITITSLDYDVIARFNVDDPLIYDGNLDLVKAVIRRLNGANRDQGMDVFLHSDAPPGSGLGSSSTVVVALIGLFKRWKHLPITDYELADLAYQIERQDLGIKGGKQDQYAATFGGFNFIEFSATTTIVNPLRVPRDTINELHHNLLLCFTGKTRLSARIIDTQVEGYVKRKEEVLEAMGNLKAIAMEMKNALLRGELNHLGALLHEAWMSKKKMAAQITDPRIDELYAAAREHGALGGKISGAGGGGYMFFYCPFDKKHQVAQALERLNAKPVDFSFDLRGLQTWEVR